MHQSVKTKCGTYQCRLYTSTGETEITEWEVVVEREVVVYTHLLGCVAASTATEQKHHATASAVSARHSPANEGEWVQIPDLFLTAGHDTRIILLAWLTTKRLDEAAALMANPCANTEKACGSEEKKKVGK